MSAEPPAAEPEHFGPYRVLGVLGSGGMGRVLRAHDAEHEREVALKVLHPQWAQDEGYRGRFRREARIAARLNEPHVIPIHRYGEIEGQLFLDMRLVEGEDLDSLLRRGGPVEPARAVDLIGQVAHALDAAHAMGLVHRDVKPSNVLLVARSDGGDLVTSAAGEDFAYLADFGIAREGEQATGPGLTATGTAIGSTEYMAPERFGPAAPDARSDVYSLACVLYELLTGRRPFAPGDPLALMYAHLHEEPPPPSTLRSSLPPGLDAVVRRGMAKDPDRRWQSAGALAAAARAALAASGVPVPHPDAAATTVGPDAGAAARTPTRTEHPGAGVPPAAAARSVPKPLLTRLTWAVAAIAVLAVLLLTAFLVVLDGRADDATADATEAGARLVALSLPADVDPAGCDVEPPADGELRRLSCPSDSQPEGVPTGRYTALGGRGAAEGFAAHVEENDLPQLEEPSDCGSSDTPQGWAEVTDPDDRVVGRLSCAVDDEGDAELRWVWDDLGTLGFAEQRGGGEDGLSSLRSWWSSEADRS